MHTKKQKTCAIVYSEQITNPTRSNPLHIHSGKKLAILRQTAANFRHVTLRE